VLGVGFITDISNCAELKKRSPNSLGAKALYSQKRYPREISSSERFFNISEINI